VKLSDFFTGNALQKNSPRKPSNCSGNRPIMIQIKSCEQIKNVRKFAQQLTLTETEQIRNNIPAFV